MNKLFRIIMSIMLMVCAGMSVAEAASYTVKRGDTLSAIAVAQKTTVKTLVALNPKITNPDRIYVGQVITTSAETRAAANEPAPTPAVKSIVRKTPSARARNIKAQTVTTSNHVVGMKEIVTSQQLVIDTSLPEQQCNITSMIRRTGFPTTVADHMVALVAETPHLNPIVVTTRDREYVLKYSDSCVFAGIERTLTSVASVRAGEDTTSYSNEHINGLSPTQGESPINPREEMRKFLTKTLGPPFNVDPIMERMDANAQMEAWGITAI